MPPKKPKITRSKNISYVWYPRGDSQGEENFSPFDDPEVRALLDKMMRQLIQDFEEDADYVELTNSQITEVAKQMDALERMDCLVDDETLEDHLPTLDLIMAAYYRHRS